MYEGAFCNNVLEGPGRAVVESGGEVVYVPFLSSQVEGMFVAGTVQGSGSAVLPDGSRLRLQRL